MQMSALPQLSELIYMGTCDAAVDELHRTRVGVGITATLSACTFVNLISNVLTHLGNCVMLCTRTKSY
jgi:hypothetical protein